MNEGSAIAQVNYSTSVRHRPSISLETGTVSGLMKNGEVITTTKYARQVTNPKSLALRSGCNPDDYCVGDEVISDDYRDTLRNFYQYWLNSRTYLFF